MEGLILKFDLTFDLFAWVLLIPLALLFCWFWQGGRRAPAVPKPPKGKRNPKPFAGYTRKPECKWCEQQVPLPPRVPGAPPPRMNFLETVDTPFHGKQVDADQLVWAMAALAEGLGIRAVARVFETNPHTVLRWLVEAAEHLEAFTHYHLHDLHVEQVQMDELFALLSAVKEGEVTEAIKRLSRSPHWVGVAMDPVCKLILTVDVGDRTQAMAQRLVHQVTQVLAVEWVPLFLTDGFREYPTALVTHYGEWIQPERRQAQGPKPKPR